MSERVTKAKGFRKDKRGGRREKSERRKREGGLKREERTGREEEEMAYLDSILDAGILFSSRL